MGGQNKESYMPLQNLGTGVECPLNNENPDYDGVSSYNAFSTPFDTAVVQRCDESFSVAAASSTAYSYNTSGAYGETGLCTNKGEDKGLFDSNIECKDEKYCSSVSENLAESISNINICQQMQVPKDENRKERHLELKERLKVEYDHQQEERFRKLYERRAQENVKRQERVRNLQIQRAQYDAKREERARKRRQLRALDDAKRERNSQKKRKRRALEDEEWAEKARKLRELRELEDKHWEEDTRRLQQSLDTLKENPNEELAIQKTVEERMVELQPWKNCVREQKAWKIRKKRALDDWRIEQEAQERRKRRTMEDCLQNEKDDALQKQRVLEDWLEKEKEEAIRKQRALDDFLREDRIQKILKCETLEDEIRKQKALKVKLLIEQAPEQQKLEVLDDNFNDSGAAPAVGRMETDD